MKGKVIKFDSKVMTAEFMVDGKETVYVADKKKLTDAEISVLSIGDEVFFEVGNPKGNNRFKVRKILAEDIVTQEDLFEKVKLPERPNELYLNNNNSNFSNPYNFVPVVKVSNNKINLFRKLFVTHDKFQGISGIVKCRLKTLSPFFVSATHNQENENHKKLSFFSTDKEKINGQVNNWRMPTVAGSTLRGLIRSVSEAVSNSSFTALSSEKLEYRAINDASKLKCGIVVKLPENKTEGIIKVLEIAKLPFNKIPNGATDGETGWANVKNGKVLDCSKSETKGYKKGFFKLTGKNVIDRKNNERFFYENENQTVSFTLDELKKYNKIIKQQKENALKAFKNDNKDIAADEVKKRNNFPLKVDDLVYFQIDKNNQSKNLGYVSIPRWQYQSSIADKIDSFFHPIEDANSLCPTSRIFGFVRDKKFSNQKDNEGKSSYAGRVYFSDAKFDTSNGKKVKYDENVVLDILGSPKPTTYEFYLYNPEDKSKIVNYNDKKARLRGRKFYLHQENKGQFWRKNNESDSQNSTLNRVLTEGNEFTFSVQFANLEDYELGLLLWSLVLESGMAHKVGMGKPLGLGSVSIEIESVEIIDRKTRYSSFLNDENTFQDGKAKNENWKTDYISKFMDWMKDIFEKEFDDLENVKDLRKLFEFSNNFQKPVHYPLCKDSDNEQFKWFVANRNSKNKKQILPYPHNTDGVKNHLERNEKPKNK